MRVLVACEHTGAIRDAFRRRGAEAWSCDLEGIEPEGDWPNYHLFGDCRWFIERPPFGGPWDLLIAHPPCQFLASSGLHWNKRRPGREAETAKALDFVRELMAAPVERIAIENPVGRIGTAIRPADQTIQPWQFGDDASKATCLWLKNLPRLRPTRRHLPRIVAPEEAPRDLLGHPLGGRPRWGNQTDAGQNKLSPAPDRAKKRAATYNGIAEAMADQWTKVLQLRQRRAAQ